MHTLPQWRGGISREAFALAMNHPEARRCALFGLDTDTRNTAHTMYREFGFVDVGVGVRHSNTLSAGTSACRPPV